jgi:hypothetical protein
MLAEWLAPTPTPMPPAVTPNWNLRVTMGSVCAPAHPTAPTTTRVVPLPTGRPHLQVKMPGANP